MELTIKLFGNLCLLLWVLPIISCTDITVFKFTNQTTLDTNKELSYATLKSEPAHPLLEGSFTICGSMYLAYLRGHQTFFSMRRSQSKNLWFSLMVYDSLFDGGHQIALCNSSGSTMNDGEEKKVILRFHDWFHACVSVDSFTGRIRAVVNGILTHDSYNEGAQSNIPIEFKGALRLGLTEKQFGKSEVSKEQSSSPVTNVNIFSGLLNLSDMIDVTASGKCTQGTLLNWGEMRWTFKGRVSDELAKDFCRSNPFSDTFIFPTPFSSWRDCINFCPKVEGKGRVPFVKSVNESRLLMDHFYQASLANKLPVADIWNSTSFAVFSSFSLHTESRFVDFYSNSTLEPELWFPGQPNGGKEAPLALWFPGLDRYLLWDYAPIPGICICQFHNSPKLTLRGVCEQSDIDEMFVLKYSNGDVVFKGLRNTDLEKDKDSFSARYQRNLVMQNKTSNANPYPLGKIWWRIVDDSKSCNDGKINETVPLKLTGCPDGYFTCDNGDCVSMEKRCDQVLNCGDETDEVDCNILVLRTSYRKMSPPSKVGLEEGREVVIPPEVTISMSLLDIAAIKEPENEIDLKFRVEFRWFEFRAFFHDLKKISARNALDSEDVERLWIPNLVYRNNKDNDDTRGEIGKSDLKIIRIGNFTRSSLNVVDEIEIFKGSENPIVMVQSYTKTFKCRYELMVFPFDTQVIHTKRCRKCWFPSYSNFLFCPYSGPLLIAGPHYCDPRLDCNFKHFRCVKSFWV